MKSKRSLMTMLVGLAMLATPITAAAKDHNHDGGKNFSRPAQTRAFNAPARHFGPARGGPAVVTNHPFRNGAGFVPAPAVAANPYWKADRKEWKHGPDRDGDADDYARYGRGGYYANPGYNAAPAYAGYGGYGRSCAHARQIMTVYQQDRYRGHPAAAADLLRQNQWAFHSGCGGAAPMGGGGLFNGFNGFAAPAYNNYGSGYGQPYGGSYNGYNGGYGQPYGGYTGYNGGYSQPYGGGLGTLLQQYVR